jgi:hypothetical protein
MTPVPTMPTPNKNPYSAVIRLQVRRIRYDGGELPSATGQSL